MECGKAIIRCSTLTEFSTFVVRILHVCTVYAESVKKLRKRPLIIYAEISYKMWKYHFPNATFRTKELKLETFTVKNRFHFHAVRLMRFTHKTGKMFEI